MKSLGQILGQKFVFTIVFLAIFAAVAVGQSNAIKLSLDASEAPRGIYHVREVIGSPPAGDFELFYPKWIPGEHAPDAPLNDLVV